MRVADKIAEVLHEKGVRHIFTITGAGIVTLLDAVANQGKIALIPTHHEQAAVMAATYYFRTSGQIAPVMVTTGAGSTNTATGVLAAYMDSIPLLVISGNEPRRYFGEPHPRVVGVQGLESHALMRPITKQSKQVVNDHDAVTSVKMAFASALRNRQGPVWIDIPQDIQRMEYADVWN